MLYYIEQFLKAHFNEEMREGKLYWQIVLFVFAEEKKSQPTSAVAGSSAGHSKKSPDPVKLTFDLPEEAARQLTELAKVGDHALRQLGILSLHVEGGKVSLKSTIVSSIFICHSKITLW